MKITWLGHACFLIEADGRRIVTDPYGEKVPYDLPATDADLVTVSHGHADHNAVGRIGGSPAIVQATGTLEAGGVTLRGIASFHDNERGAKRGENILYLFELEGLRLAHLGDLGAPLDAAQKEALSEVDVVLCPVGGTYTIDAQQAAELASGLPRLRVLIPMHYKTDRLADWPIETVDGVARLMENVRRVGGTTVELTREILPDRLEVWILDYA